MGSVTVGVSLPRDWITRRGLAIGSPVYLRTLPNGSLLLRDRTETPGTASVTLVVSETEPGEHVFRRLVAAYLRGADEFVLHQPNGLSSEARKMALAFARRTVQPEVVSEDERTLVLRDVSRENPLPMPRLLRRMFQVVLELHRTAGATWTDGSRRDSSGPLDLLDDEVDRYAWLVERLLGLEFARAASGSGNGASPSDALQLLLLARALERIGDHAVQIAEQGTHLREASVPAALARSLSDYHEQVLANFASAFAVAERPNPDSANEIIDAGEALHAAHAALTERFLVRGGAKLSPPVVTALGLLLQSIDRTTAYAQDIAQVGLDRDASVSAAKRPTDTAASARAPARPAARRREAKADRAETDRNARSV
jgi:phosphate uptake regulator